MSLFDPCPTLCTLLPPLVVLPLPLCRFVSLMYVLSIRLPNPPPHSLSFAATPTLLLHSIGVAPTLPTSLLSLQATFLDHPRFARFKSLLKRRPLLWSYWEEQDEIDISRTVYCALLLSPSAHTPHTTTGTHNTSRICHLATTRYYALHHTSTLIPYSSSAASHIPHAPLSFSSLLPVSPLASFRSPLTLLCHPPPPPPSPLNALHPKR